MAGCHAFFALAVPRAQQQALSAQRRSQVRHNPAQARCGRQRKHVAEEGVVLSISIWCAAVPWMHRDRSPLSVPVLPPVGLLSRLACYRTTIRHACAAIGAMKTRATSRAVADDCVCGRVGRRSGRRDAGNLKERVRGGGKVWLAESRVEGARGRDRWRACVWDAVVMLASRVAIGCMRGR